MWQMKHGIRLSQQDNKALQTACDDLNHILGTDAAVTPEQLIAGFASPEELKKLYDPQNTIADLRHSLIEKDGSQLSSSELVAKGLNAFRKWALAGFSLVGPEEREKRFAACKVCEFYVGAPKTALYQLTNTGNICSQCGCSVDKKIRLATEHCPVIDTMNPTMNRWGDPLSIEG